MTDELNQIGSVGEYRSVPVGDLRLDPDNPRIPQSYRGLGQDDLAVVLEMGFEAYAVAQSMASSGFFMGEPLLVIASDEEPGAFVVVEGNRRLTALIGLTRPEIRAQFTEAEKWEQLSQDSKISPDSMIPVVVHESRELTFAQIGRAHVLGKLQWRPYAQALYIAARIEEGRTYAEVAEMIGITRAKVADLYRDQAIVAQAESAGLDTGEIEKAFSILTVAMSNVKLRDHIGAPLGSQFVPGKNPVPKSKLDELAETISWIFGSEEEEPKISDSRQIAQLGNVVGSAIGLKALREGASLEEAKQKIAATGLAPRERLMNRFTAAKNALLAATDDFSEFVNDQEVRALFDDVGSALEALQSTIDELESEPES